MLVGRRAERTRLDQLVEGLSDGDSAALVLVGEPGVGKTVLLDYARQRARGARILAASGFEGERDLPFAGLSILLRPLSAQLDALPGVQRRALGAALGREQPADADRFAAYVAVLSLLATAAETSPLVVTVDDAHWLDAASAEALVFSARRLGQERILMLFAARDAEHAKLEAAGLSELPLSGLDADAAATLLHEHSGQPVPASVAGRLWEATAGNPLALAELANLLDRAQLEGRAPLADPLPAGAEVERAFGSRVRSLPASTQSALTVAAADATVSLELLADALRRIRLALSELEPAEAAHLVALANGGVEFRHPLLRSVAYQRANGPERRAAHRALAEALATDQDRGRRAWHRAAATAHPDERVAAELEAVASEARARGAPAAAGRALLAAARVTPTGETRVRRLLAGAQAFGLAGDPEAARPLLDAALSVAAGDARLRADIQLVRATVELMSGSPSLMRDLLLAEAGRVRPHDEARAALLLIHAGIFSVMAGDQAQALRLARDGFPVASRMPGMAGVAAYSVLSAALLSAGHAEEARPLLEHASQLVEQEDLFFTSAMSTGFALSYQWLEEYELSAGRIGRIVARARERGAAVALPFALAGLAEIELRLGNWTSAYAAANESVTLAEDTGQRGELAHSLARLAQVEAGLGRERDCRVHTKRCLEICNELDMEAPQLVAVSAMGLLDLGVGRLDAAVEHLESTGRRCLELGLYEPNIIAWAQDLAEAYIRLGEREPAERTLATLSGQADQTGGRLARAAVARCLGLLAQDDDEASDWFARALALHDERPAPFERARTELCSGERLRRARRRTAARERLRSALESFDRLGAAPWAERARRELAATGERARRRAPTTRDELTGQELQVALVVAEGATNREAAVQLFVSPKTIETHLSHIYRKLGVRSRTELARALDGDRPTRR
jgi:DNA-binding CsgD family transcriptional regulator